MTRRAKYQSVNAVWPDSLPALTAPEAITAAKRLWRKTMGAPCPYRVVVATGIHAGRLPSGRHGTRMMRDDRRRQIVLVVQTRYGWDEFVHSLSHKCHRRLHPGAPDHDDLGRHAFVEREMIRHVVASGWLDGKLRRPEKPKAPINRSARRYKQTLAAIERWQRKRKRAERALAKLAKRRRYYETAAAAGTTTDPSPQPL